MIMYSFYIILLVILLHGVQNTDMCIRLLVKIILDQIHVQKAISVVYFISFVSIYAAPFSTQKDSAQDDLNK